MKNKDSLFLILVNEIQQELNENKMNNTLVKKLKFAMNIAKKHWLIIDPDIQFRGAIGGVMMHYGKESEEFKRLEWEIQQLKKLDATIAAARAGLSVTFNIIGNNEYSPIEILKLWRKLR